MVMTSSEWLLVDSRGESQFRHEGETILPGCCTRWTALRPQDKEGVVLRDESAPETDKDPTLPWQVVMIGSEDQVQEFHNRAHHRSFRIRQMPAIGCSSCDVPVDDTPAEPAEDTVAAWSAEVDASLGRRKAFALVRRARLLRAERNFEGARQDIDASLAVLPRFTCARFELALLMLDTQRYAEATRALRVVYQQDREWPYLSNWIIRAHAHAKRDPDDDLYAILGVRADFTADELKRSYRRSSLAAHPDKVGGSQEKFSRIGVAHDILSSPDQRREYDEGFIGANGARVSLDDNPHLSLRAEVERAFFPELQQVWPFGDPLEDHEDLRKLRNRRAREAEDNRATTWYDKHETPEAQR